MLELGEEIERSAITKEEIVKLLSTDAQALAAFEAAYTQNVLNSDYVSENIFEVNSRQAAALHKGQLPSSSEQLNDIKNRIVNELLSKAVVWKFDGTKASTICDLGKHVDMPVTNAEINVLPKYLRPQLTGSLMQRDIDEPAYISLLTHYWHYLNDEDPQKRMLHYHIFRQGLDILDLDEITRQIIATNKNSMGYWLPHMVKPSLDTGVLKIPKTTIVKVPTTMLQLTRCQYEELTRTTLDIVNEFCHQAFELDDTSEYFIKTGTYSSKFDFRNAYVHGSKEVQELGEYLLFIHYQALLMAGHLSKPTILGASTTDEWVVREFIQDVEKNPCIYKGLPLHTEYRIFVDLDTKEVIGMSPYWEPNVMKKRFGTGAATSPHNAHDYIIYSMHEPVLMQRYNQNKELVRRFVQDLIAVTNNLSGQWSIDIMQNGNDFWLIDMALAENSALYDCVPKRLRKKTPENWMPVLK